MNSNDEDTQVFIVRLWREVREIMGARPLLRATVEHVASGEKRYFKDLSDLLAFLSPYSEGVLADFEDDLTEPSAFDGKVVA
jgi:hypothetical protein